jgi:hypothetical protein
MLAQSNHCFHIELGRRYEYTCLEMLTFSGVGDLVTVVSMELPVVIESNRFLLCLLLT